MLSLSSWFKRSVLCLLDFIGKGFLWLFLKGLKFLYCLEDNLTQLAISGVGKVG